jgi:hypothetical protein
MLAERFEIHVDEAFERLRHEARSRRMKLNVLAAAVTAREAWAEAIDRPARVRPPRPVLKPGSEAAEADLPPPLGEPFVTGFRPCLRGLSLARRRSRSAAVR